MTQSPRVVLFGGPNGAGKTTISSLVLPQTMRIANFVNADTIAQGLSGFSAESVAIEAARIMWTRIHELAEARADFAFESTLAAKSPVAYLRQWQAAGYVIELHYVWLPSADLCVARVARRIRAGGHSVPEKVIRQRYERSLHNLFKQYLPLANRWAIYDNTIEGKPRVIANYIGERTVEIHDQAAWAKIQMGAKI